MKLRSPVAVGIVLGLLVGAGAAAAIAATSSSGEPPRTITVVQARPSEPPPGSIERVAAAFDMHAGVIADAGGWVVRDGNRLLRVERTSGLPWFFSNGQPSCTLVPEEPPAGEPLQTVPASGPSECPEEKPPADGVSQDDALVRGTDTLTRAGLGPSMFEIVDQPGGWYIQAEPQSAAGLPWTISIGPGPTINAASGYLTAENR